MVKAAQDSERGRQAALAELSQMKQAYRSEVIKSVSLRVERETVKVEIAVLLDENRSLWEAVRALNERVDESFELGYFTTSH